MQRLQADTQTKLEKLMEQVIAAQTAKEHAKHKVGACVVACAVVACACGAVRARQRLLQVACTAAAGPAH